MTETSDERAIEQYASTQSVNILQDPGVIQMRLNASPTLKEVETTLTGFSITIEYRDDQYLEVKQEISKPKANSEGVRSLMSYVRIFANPQALTGNIKNDTFMNYIGTRRKELNDMVMRNRKSWGINDADINVIIDMIMNCIYIELTHALDAGTRNSLTHGTKTTEVIGGGQQKKGIFGQLFSR